MSGKVDEEEANSPSQSVSTTQQTPESPALAARERERERERAPTVATTVSSSFRPLIFKTEEGRIRKKGSVLEGEERHGKTPLLRDEAKQSHHTQLTLGTQFLYILTAAMAEDQNEQDSFPLTGRSFPYGNTPDLSRGKRTKKKRLAAINGQNSGSSLQLPRFPSPSSLSLGSY